MKRSLLMLLCEAEKRYYDLKKAIAEGDKNTIAAICCTSMVASEEDIQFSELCYINEYGKEA